MRAFIGIALPDDVRRAAHHLQQDLAESGADVKWVAPANLHVTLKFLGEITEEQRTRMEDRLARVAHQEEPFEAGLDRVGAVPSMTAPRVIWVGVGQGRESVVRLAEAIERESSALSFPREERSFAAHVTLGRVRSPRNRQALVERLRGAAWQPPGPWRVTSVTFYQSILESSGPTYTILADVPLGGS